MVVYDRTYALKDGQGSSDKANNNFIIAHSTANIDAGGRNEASYMQRMAVSNKAYTHAIADTDKVYIIGEPGYVAWGAGNINPYSPFQIELAEYSNKDKAKAAYANYISAIREYAAKYGIPLVLDGKGNGIKSHLYASQTYGGSDHSDPYGYLTSIGISKAQFAKDIANGVSVGSTVWKENTNNHGIVTVNYSGKGDVRLTWYDGHMTDTYVKNNSKWKVSDIIRAGLLIGNESYLPFKYSKITIDYQPGYGINAVDKDGIQIKGTNKKFKSGTSWKVLGGFMNGKVAYFKVSSTEYIKGTFTK